MIKEGKEEDGAVRTGDDAADIFAADTAGVRLRVCEHEQEVHPYRGAHRHEDEVRVDEETWPGVIPTTHKVTP